MSRWTIACMYFNTMFFNFLFRVILIRFADRGLVSEGRPNLKLFHQLYWTISAPFLFIFIVNYPIKPILNGTFTESTQARICLQRALDTEEEGALRGRILSLIFPCLCQILNRYFSAKVSTFLSGLCPNKRMSCIGKFRRNLIDLADTSMYITCWALYACLDNILLLMAITTSSPVFAPQSFFFLYNLVSFVFIDIFHGLVIPLRMDLSWNRKHIPQAFYMNNQTSLEPRRYTVGWKRVPRNPPPSPLLAQRNLMGLRMPTLLMKRGMLVVEEEEERGMPMVEVMSTIRYCSKCNIYDRKEMLEGCIARKLQIQQ